MVGKHDEHLEEMQGGNMILEKIAMVMCFGGLAITGLGLMLFMFSECW